MSVALLFANDKKLPKGKDGETPWTVLDD